MVSATATLAERAAALSWYHSIDLAPGVTTKGWFDLRPSRDHVPLPARLDGLRVLDVGTWDGFWAFEMEARGADEVVAIDVLDPARWDWPPRERELRATGGLEMLQAVKGAGEAFDLAAEALGSHVKRLDLSVYDLDPDVVGEFDLVFFGSLLLHLRDPVRALDRVRAVCSGEVVVADTVEAIPTLLRPRTPVARLEAEGRPWWWLPNRAALHRMIRAAGFDITEASDLYFVPRGEGHVPSRRRDLLRRLRTPGGREEVIVALKGIPHAAVRARPVPS